MLPFQKLRAWFLLVIKCLAFPHANLTAPFCCTSDGQCCWSWLEHFVQSQLDGGWSCRDWDDFLTLLAVQAIGWNWRASFVLQEAQGSWVPNIRTPAYEAPMCRPLIQADSSPLSHQGSPLPPSTISKFNLLCLGKTHNWDILQFDLEARLLLLLWLRLDAEVYSFI